MNLPTHATRRIGLDPALIVMLAGVAAALHVGKLPPALPVLQQALGLSLVQSGFLVSLVQMAGMLLGLLVGLAGESLGQRRCMAAGLVVLSASSVAGGFCTGATGLLILRALEGAGLLLAVTPGPSLIRRVAAPGEIDAKMGVMGRLHADWNRARAAGRSLGAALRGLARMVVAAGGALSRDGRMAVASCTA